MNALAIAAAVRGGRLHAVDLAATAVQRARDSGSTTNAFHTVDADGASARAAEVDAMVAAGADPGPLAGVPVAVKDNIVQTGLPCTCGSRILADYVGSYDAHVIERLRDAGAVIVGRTNMDEFAMGSSNETCAWGPVKNPLDLERVPGGSSGGSAAAVAGGVVPLALGSETGGSVRLPAAYTGLVGLKPTYGRVSRRGLVAYASSTDQVSPFAQNVADCALLAQVIAGHDPGDSTSADQPSSDWVAAASRGVAGLRLGVPAEYFDDSLDDAVRAVVEAAIDGLRAAGAQIVPVSLPSTDVAVACYYVIAPAEASANLARFDGVRYGNRVDAADPDSVYRQTRSQGFGAEVQRRILIGTYVLSAGYIDAYYNRAQRVRAQLGAELSAVLQDVDALVSPTAPTTAFRFGEKSDPVQMYLTDRYTIPASLAGIPAISVPCGMVDGLPVGLQVMADAWDEATCFAIAGAVEAAGQANKRGE